MEISRGSYYNVLSNPDAIARYEEQVHRCYSIVEAQLRKSDGSSILPGGMTSADLHWYPWTMNPEFLGLDVEAYPMMKKWRATMAERPEVKRAFARILEAAKADGIINSDESGKIVGADQSLLQEVKGA
jgi:glutathione S-transferase